MRTPLPLTLTVAAAICGLLAPSLRAVPAIEPPTLEDALLLKGGKMVVFQPYQMKRGQTLVVTHTSFSKKVVRPGLDAGAMLVVYSTDPADYGHILYQDIYIPSAAAGPGAGPHVKVFSGASFDADQKGIIAILIGLLLPANSVEPRWVPLPPTDAASAEIHDPNAGLGLLLPAVQKVRQAAAR
jgi:hypothetical protein